MSTLVGIDDINLYAGSLAVEFADIVEARGMTEQVYQNVGFIRRSVLPGYEDPVTLAVNAAQPLLDTHGSDGIELLIVATETGLDYGKPISSYVHRYLQLGSRCRNFEVKHACYGGTAALQMAASWVAGAAPGKKALVITTDLARRHFGESSELSTGAGSVAMLLTQSPRLLELETLSGVAAQEVYDVARPSASSERIDILLSIASYLDLLESALRDYQAQIEPSPLATHFDFMVYHTPLVALVRQAHQLFFEKICPTSSPSDYRASFEKMVSPSLHYARDIGNVYSGALYAALLAVLEHAPSLRAGQRIGSFSYGSGACAELFSWRLGEGIATPWAHRNAVKEQSRHTLSVPDYERAILTQEQSLTAENFAPDCQWPLGLYDEMYAGKQLLVLDSVCDHERHYRRS